MHPSLRHRLLNLVHSALLLAGMGLIAWTCSSAVFGPVTSTWVLVGILTGLVIAPAVPKRLVLSAYNARCLSWNNFPHGKEILFQITERAGLPRAPELYCYPSSEPNAFAVGSVDDNAIAVSDGLLRLLNRRELAGVLAHEVSHIANRDLWIMALADLMSRATAIFSIAGQLVLLVNLPMLIIGRVTVPWIVPIVLICAPTLMSLLQLALSRAREFDADLGAVHLTRDPIGLASALSKIEHRSRGPWERILLPRYRSPEPSLLRTHPPTEQRITRLLDLSQIGQGPEPAWARSARRVSLRAPYIPDIRGGDFIT